VPLACPCGRQCQLIERFAVLTDHGNPFLDVSLSARFTQGTNSKTGPKARRRDSADVNEEVAACFSPPDHTVTVGLGVPPRPRWSRAGSPLDHGAQEIFRKALLGREAYYCGAGLMLAPPRPPLSRSPEGSSGHGSMACSLRDVSLGTVGPPAIARPRPPRHQARSSCNWKTSAWSAFGLVAGFQTTCRSGCSLAKGVTCRT
jgi:hypothetical protein